MWQFLSPLCVIALFLFFFHAINRPYSDILTFLLSNAYIILYILHTGGEDGRFSSENPSKIRLFLIMLQNLQHLCQDLTLEC